MELEIIALISGVTKLRCEFFFWENRLWDALFFSVSGLHLIYCWMANTNSVRVFFFPPFKGTLLKVVPM